MESWEFSQLFCVVWRGAMNIVDIIAEVKSADMVLVGLGEEFDGGKRLKDSAEYVRGKETLKE